MKLRFGKIAFILVILLIPIFKPIGLAYYKPINIIFQLWKVVSLFVMLLWILKMRHVSINIGLCFFYIFWLIYLIATYISGGDVIDSLMSVAGIVVTVTFLYQLIRHGYLEDVFHGMAFLFCANMLIHYFSIVIIRRGIILFQPLDNDFTYYLGTDNYAAFAIIPMLGIILLRAQYCFGKIRWKEYILVGAFFLASIYTWSVTATIAGFGLLCLMVIKQWRKVLNVLLNPKFLLVISCLGLVLIVKFHIQEMFSDLLYGLLKKDITLNSRTFIWDKATELFGQSKLIGHGQLSETAIGNYVLYGTTHAHNIFLDILVSTGIFGTISYFIFLLFPLTKKQRRKSAFSLYAITAVFAAFMVLCFNDFYIENIYMYAWLAIIYGGIGYGLKERYKYE